MENQIHVSMPLKEYEKLMVHPPMSSKFMEILREYYQMIPRKEKKKMFGTRKSGSDIIKLMYDKVQR